MFGALIRAAETLTAVSDSPNLSFVRSLPFAGSLTPNMRQNSPRQAGHSIHAFSSKSAP